MGIGDLANVRLGGPQRHRGGACFQLSSLGRIFPAQSKVAEKASVVLFFGECDVRSSAASSEGDAIQNPNEPRPMNIQPVREDAVP